jgi:methionyl-tRNA formyltransferase
VTGVVVTDKKLHWNNPCDLRMVRTIEEVDGEDIVFFPHYSKIIPQDFWVEHECVLFHCTDLPFGRGGSPIQNLISRGIYETKISAIRVNGTVDGGDIYMKVPFNMERGSVDDILARMWDVIAWKMIPNIMTGIKPRPQEGQIVEFTRRVPHESILSGTNDRGLYDFVRMLDGEGYPNAYIDVGCYRLKFRNAKLVDGKFSAEVFV